MALVPMPGKLKFDQDWLEWYFLMRDEAALNDDVFVYLTARTVEHIRNSKLLDAGQEDEKAIEDRLADRWIPTRSATPSWFLNEKSGFPFQKVASRKFDRGEFASTVMQSNRIIKISPADLDE